jgi:hypothetical protein
VASSVGSYLAVTPDGRILASGSVGVAPLGSRKIDVNLHLWEVATGREICQFEPGSATVSSLAFAPDGRRLLSGLTNGTTVVWDTTRPLGQGRPALAKITTEELKTLGSDLADENPSKAYQAVWSLVAVPDQAVPFLKERVLPAAPTDLQLLARLIADLGGASFDAREKATTELEKLGELALPKLRQAMAESPSAEVRQRAEKLFEKLRGLVPAGEALRGLRAVQTLEYIATPEAKQQLESLAKGAPEARLTQEAKASLERLNRQAAAAP